MVYCPPAKPLVFVPSVEKRAVAVLNYGFDLSPAVAIDTTNPWAAPPPAPGTQQIPWLSPGEVVMTLSVTVSPSTPGQLTDLVVDLFTINTNAQGIPASLLTAWLSGGTPGQTYVVNYQWSTNSVPVARVDARDLNVIVIPN